MEKKILTTCCLMLTCIWLLTQCTEARTEENKQTTETKELAQTGSQTGKYGGFESQIKYGEHLVLIGACHDCHTPKKMTDKGPVIDFSLALSGHPAKMPIPDIDRKEIESKGLAVTQTLTAWVGPWGVSYAANLTPHKTGIGTWEEKNFFTALREGKHKGVATARTLLPPMPWDMYRNMTDEEIRAIFAYLKSIKPIDNTVPPPQPPVTSMSGK
jgi:mono/diheme cytochrome c family protein